MLGYCLPILYRFSVQGISLETFKYYININNTMITNQCKLCGYEWESVLNKPKQCPRCKRYDWEKQITIKSEEKEE